MIEIKITEPLDIAKGFIDTVRQYSNVNKCKRYAYECYGRLRQYERRYPMTLREMRICKAFDAFMSMIMHDTNLHKFMDAVDKLDYIIANDDILTSCSIESVFTGDNKKEDEITSEVISWDEYFMELARTAAKRSKDPKCKVGACIMDPIDNRVISLGYNGFPYGCSDKEFPWSKTGDDNKYLYVVHAEANAILSAHRDLTGCKLYCTYAPCNECIKIIIQSGIKEVVYDRDCSNPKDHANIAMLKMAKAAGITLMPYSSILQK